MLNKMFERLGIGGLKVETVLDQTEVRPGGQITGNVVITGGAGDWGCEKLIVELQSYCQFKMTDGESVPQMIGMALVNLRPGLIASASKESFPFVIDVPLTTPVTGGATKSAMTTRLDVEMAVDPTDMDPVTILPTEQMAAVLKSVAAQGFLLHEAEASYDHRRETPIRQIFEFRPTGHHQSRIHELEVSFVTGESLIEITISVDRKIGLADSGGERNARFTIGKDQIDSEAVDAAVKDAIVALGH